MRFVQILLAALLVLAAFVLVRTFSYGTSADSTSVALPEALPIDGAQVAEHLSEAIGFMTVTVTSGDPRPGQDGPWLALHEWLQSTYPAAHAVMQREKVAGLTLLYTWPGSDPDLAPLLFMAHQDVVPVNLATVDDWTAPPFAGHQVDGNVYGRGALDDKGSMIAQMEALEALAASGFMPKRTIMLSLGHDEEVSGSGAKAVMALLKDRGIRPEMALDEGFFVIAQSPMSGKPMGLIGVSEKGYVTVQLTSVAVGGHSSTPPRDSAAVQLSRAIVALEENQMPSHLDAEPVATLFSSSAAEMSFLQRMAFANQWLFAGIVDSEMADIPAANAMIRTTTAPTMLSGSVKENVLPQRASALVNFRIHPLDSIAAVLEHVKAVTADIPGIEVKLAGQGIDGTEPSPVSSSDSRTFNVLASVAQDLVDEPIPIVPGLVVGGTDARYAALITDQVYRFAPAVVGNEDLSGFHGTNERISLANLQRMARSYGRIMQALASE